MEKIIYSAGYGNMGPEAFVAKLKDAGVTDVMDVRRKGSGAWCGAYRWGCGNGFGGIEQLLKVAGIKYTTEDQFGKKEEDSLDEYKTWLDGQADMVWCAAHGVGFFMRQDSNRKFCLICAEGDVYEKDGTTPRCHRWYVAAALVKELGEGWSVYHL